MRVELRLRQKELAGMPVETVYFGGGTPSLLSAVQIKSLVQEVQRIFLPAAGAEWTIEVNPDDVNPASIAVWNRLGFNRLSMGLQSFDEAELRWMNRAHTAAQSTDALREALVAFPNTSIDLIYGSPLLSDRQWEETVGKVLDAGVPHISAYALTVEEKTALHHRIARGESQPVDPDKAAHQFALLMQWLSAAGFEHYEVSNWALPGMRSRHNSSYWQGKPYVGIGPSAHSYNGTDRRSWNVSNNALYAAALMRGELPAEAETLSTRDRYNERVMIALRQSDGLSLEEMESSFPKGWTDQTREVLEKHKSRGKVVGNGNRYALTEAGFPLADGIAAEAFA